MFAPSVDGEGRVEEPVSIGPEPDGVTDVVAIDLGGVNERRVLIQLFAGSQPLLTGQRSGERDTVSPSTRRVECGEVGVVLRDGDGPALGMHRLGRVAPTAIQDGIGEALNKTEKIY